MQKSPGKPGWQGQEGPLFQLFADRPQTDAQKIYDLKRQVRFGPDCGKQIVPPDPAQAGRA